MYINIDDTFFIKDEINNEALHQCISFIAKQKSVSKFLIEKAYKNKKLTNIKLPGNVFDKNLDIIIKRKFNNDLKFVNLNESEIFYEYNDKSRLFLDKINKFKLKDIKFFPPTYFNDNLIFQKLTKGTYYRPSKLSEFNKDLLNNIKEIIVILSSLNKEDSKVSEYLSKALNNNAKDKLNSEIISSSISKLKEYHNENIKLSLTHGDFKFEHLFLLDGRIEYIIDWENVGIRSIYFDLFNFFVPWFARRSYKYFEIKDYILNFIQNYLPNLLKNIKEKYDLYFCIFVVERYRRINDARSLRFDEDEAHNRFNLLFKNLIN